MKKIIPSSILIASAFPLLTSAQLTKTSTLLRRVTNVLETIITIAIMLAFLFFVWGLAQFIRKAGEPAAREEGRQRMIWGIVALAVLATIWGIVQWLQGEFGLTTGSGPAELMKQFGF